MITKLTEDEKEINLNLKPYDYLTSREIEDKNNRVYFKTLGLKTLNS